MLSSKEEGSLSLTSTPTRSSSFLLIFENDLRYRRTKTFLDLNRIFPAINMILMIIMVSFCSAKSIQNLHHHNSDPFLQNPNTSGPDLDHKYITISSNNQPQQSQPFTITNYYFHPIFHQRSSQNQPILSPLITKIFTRKTNEKINRIRVVVDSNMEYQTQQIDPNTIQRDRLCRTNLNKSIELICSSTSNSSANSIKSRPFFGESKDFKKSFNSLI